MVNKIQKGGDGYTINVNQPIGGLAGFSRYSDNYRPVFYGDLIKDNNGYSVNNLPIHIDSETLQNGGNNDCGCNLNNSINSINSIKEDLSIFDLIKQTAGGEKIEITQFSAIQELSYLLTPLSIKNLLYIILHLFLNILNNSDKEKKSKQFGGYSEDLQSILAPLGKNNLLVLSSLLLLHYFAVETQKKNNTNNKINILKGGDPFISFLNDSLSPIGLNSMKSSVVLEILQDAFLKKKIQKGGNKLKNLIAPLGTSAFIATGLLIIIERMFTSRVNEIKKNHNNKLVGGKVNKKYEELFNLIAPITFNTFARESFIKDFAKNNLKEDFNKNK